MRLLADGVDLNPLQLYTILSRPIEWALVHLESAFHNVGFLSSIGPFGVAIIAVTLIIRTLLFPVYQWQLKTTRRVQAEQRRIAPQMQALRRKYKGDPRTLQEEMMKLYKEHDISPLSQMSGCLPLLIQLPVLYGLYSGTRNAAGQVSDKGFLFIHDLSENAKDAVGGSDLGGVLGGLITHPWYLIIPGIAAAATFVQTKITIQPPRPNMSDQERQMYSVSRNMAYLAPGVVLLTGVLLPMGLPLYWATQSVMMIGQQWYLLGWGALKVPDWFPGAHRVTPLSYNQPESEVVEAVRHHHGETRPVRPKAPAANGRARNARPAAGTGAGPRPQRAEAGKGGRPQAQAGNRPAAGRQRPPTRSGNPARGKRRRGR